MKNCTNLCYLGLCLLSLSLVSGCGGPSTVDAVPRTSPNTPVFGAKDVAANGGSNDSPTAKNDLDLGFLHNDHFACISIDVNQVVNNKDLADVPWDSLEEQAKELVGEANSNLALIDRAWVLVDRESMDFMAAKPVSPVVIVLDYANPIDKDALDEAAKARAEKLADQKDEKKKTAPQMETKLLGDRRIVVGGQKLIEKINNKGASSDLARKLQQLELGTEVNGVLSMEPIRNTLQDFFDVASTFGGEKFKKLSALPDATQSVEFELSISNDNLLNVVVQMDDPELAKEVSKIVRDSMEQSGGSGGAGMMPFGALAGGGMGGGGRMPKQMIPTTSQDIMQEIGTEISENDLFSVSAVENDIVFQLKRPEKTKELVEAMLVDGRRQLALVSRVQNLQKIGKAMEAYNKEHGFLPPSGSIKENSDGIPPQLNWRVGLLPFLDNQELYDRFDFSKAWDSPENLEVAKDMPEVFSRDANEDGTESCFHLIGGEFGLHKKQANAPKLADLADKKIWSAIIIETGSENATAWTKPGALAVSESKFDVLGEAEEKGVLFLTASFDAKIIEKAPEKLRAILTTAGDERLAKRDFLPTGLN